jgi:hypothetical protein
MFDNYEDEKTARRRILAQGRHILQSIIEAYSSGKLDDPIHSANLCTLFALAAEGKVTASFDEDSAETKWTMGQKIVTGPWQNSVDTNINT